MHSKNYSEQSLIFLSIIKILNVCEYVVGTFVKTTFLFYDNRNKTKTFCWDVLKILSILIFSYHLLEIWWNDLYYRSIPIKSDSE